MEGLTAAIPAVDPSKNLSSQEFQDLLTSWFEQKGILSELRTNLRYKMINILKNTTIGRDIIRKSPPSSMSLSKQAVNLIVAEFLMRNHCDYSLSLFNTEAGLSTSFSDNIVNENNKLISLQFDRENILNILELIGVHKTSDLCQEILNIYYKNCDNISLLSALITVLSKSVPENVQAKKEINLDLSTEVDFIKNIGALLIKSNMPTSNIIPIIENIKCLYKVEIHNLEENYTKILTKLKSHVNVKDKRTKEIQKQNEMLELKILQLIEKQNELRTQAKRAVKEKLSKEKELLKTKRDFKEDKTVPEPVGERDPKTECAIQHCSESCRDNSKLIGKLQKENSELSRKNQNCLEEINDWKNKYNKLLLDFSMFHTKISSLNGNGSVEIPISSISLNPKMIDSIICDEKNNLKSVDGSDSSTDELIRDARKKIKVLEEENLELEEIFKKNQSKKKLFTTKDQRWDLNSC
ncbi:uncharacterized protein LOC126885835 [Diabrotica virgifera virgifera]|uniref:LisH domain-containing protein n=1 Tax=Diabrotica virgifera virgifera TaxID=50390 RepID=A0ABM5KEB6_DIAVI|nr:uncharacterized protein LOC126885835 [Diabrotica virgifera virgifera]